MLSLKGITKNYYLSKTNVVKVLKGVDIDFRKNEFVSILGASGCGKTTLLNVIGGLDAYEGGELLVDGVSTKNYTASDWDNYRNKKIGFVFQSYNLIQHLNVVRNVEMPLILAGEKKAVARQKAIELLKRVGLEEQIYKKPLQLSGGQMQRVAIARALVSDPEIILADEPTGALDNEASVSVMALLKEIAEDHLIIMVTHNDLLAKEYSTRIINLSGGVVCGDSNPYEPTEEDLAAETAPVEEPRAAVAETEPVTKNARGKKARKEKSHLSFKTATELSARNLISKKVRTALTSFAGSIGIIGIVLVLAFSSGVSMYIENLERSALSLYPMTISEKESSPERYLSILQKMMNGMQSDERDAYPDTEEIYTNRVMANAVTDILSLNADENDLVSFKKYIDENFDEKLGYIKYDYGVPINVYCPDPNPDVAEYMKVNPFIELMTEKMKDLNVGNDNFAKTLSSMAANLGAWSELSDNKSVLESQYELVGKNSRWPSYELTDGISEDGRNVKVAEIVVAVDERNQLNDYSLFILGLRSGTTDEIMKALGEFEDATYTVDDLLQLTYRVLGSSDYVVPAVNEETSKTIENRWAKVKSTEQSKEFVESNYSVLAKVVGVVRPKQGSSVLSISGTVGYNSSLKSYLIERANNHPATKYMQETIRESDNSHADPFSDGYLSDANYKTKLTEMGVADLEKPTKILIYANSFEQKKKIVQFIDEYNNNVGDKQVIKYSDTLSTIMSYVNTMSTAVSSALIGFMSVSLIVSSIMIAVIIYTSVLERRKEVGILRSVGARKKDIVSIFMAESGILGLSSGLLGVFIGWIITLPLKKVLLDATGIPNLAVVEWWHVVMMIAISFGLSVLAGFVPSFLGAKQDPAVALRTD